MRSAMHLSSGTPELRSATPRWTATAHSTASTTHGNSRWFIRVLESSGDETPLKFHPQISPDGLFWCDEGSDPLVVAGRGLYTLPLREFGHWLRLRADFAEAETTIKVLIYLALKA